LFPADAQAFFGTQAVDAAFDVEQCIDAPDGLQRNRRDRWRLLSAARTCRDIGQLEELPPCVGPAQSRGDRALST